MQVNNIDAVVLALVKGKKAIIKASIKRLYQTGDISSAELAAYVGRLIDLADYNEIIGNF